ncbi:MAG TPA: hypothetical protein VIW64_09145, partial [Pyrinomonadaceae bacterium]
GAPAPKVGAATQEGGVAPGVVELKGMSDFTPPAPVTAFLDANRTSKINARFGDLAQGPLEVKRAGKGKYHVSKQPLPLNHPAFAFVTQFVPGLAPALVIGVENNKLKGEVGLASGAKVQRISSYIQKTPDMLGLAGFTIGALPTIVNAIEGGSLHFGLKAVPIKLGSAFSGKFNFDVIDTNVSFDASAAIVVQGLANGTLDLKRAPSGLITGRAAIGLSLGKSQNFSGNVDVAWDGVAITGMGKVGYKGEKFSGEVTLQMMERNQALQLAQSKQSPPAGAAKAAAAKKPMKIDYVVFGEGDLNFSFTEWLNGTAHVIVDPKGNLTVIGKITPQKEFILFPQKDYIRPLFKFEARASYGIPVVGNIFIFANVGMDLFAKLGPAKFYNIVVDGTYSTDPTVAKNFTIQGSLNISAAAGARLRAEAGAGLEILSHDIKAGAGINGIAGIKAYAEATPVIGYREKAAEGQDTKGEWFVRGDLELAAQPFLGLSGDLFVEISTPWWSPLSDHRWTWPLFSKEWPLGSSMGMLVSVDYVFGSGQWPKFDLKPVEFDSNKFMTGLYEDSAKSGPGKELEQKGKWQEKNSAAAQPPPKGSQTGSAKPGKLDSGKAKTKQAKAKKLDKPVDPNAKTKEGKTVKQLKDEAQKKGKGGKGGKVESKGMDNADSRLLGAITASQKLMATPSKEEEAVEAGLPPIAREFALKSLRLVKNHEGLWHVEAEINPKRSGSPNPLFTRTQLNMLKKLGERTAREIHEHRAEGWPAQYRADKRGFLRNPNRVVVGKPVEVAGTHLVEQLAYDAKLSVLRNVGLQFLDATGADVGGVQHELDFVIVGPQSVVEIISAKTNPGQLSVSGDRAKLAHMRDLPLQTQQLREYAIQHFVGAGSVGASVWNRVTGAVVVFNDRGDPMRMPLADFRSRYLAKVAVEKLNVRSLTPAQPAGGPQPNIALAANSNELLDQLIVFIDKNLP